MKKGMLFLAVIISLFFIQSVGAFEMTLSSPRNTYQPYETFQAEVRFDVPPANRLAVINLLLENERGQVIPINPSLTRITDTHYFIFFKTPYTSWGDYSFIVKDVTYLDRKDNRLKQTSSRLTFFINATNQGFQYILGKQAPERYFVSVKDAKSTALASLALKKTYMEFANESAAYLEENIKAPENCFPIGECKVIDTVWSLLALKEFNLEANPNPWLIGAMNKHKQGEWVALITSHNTSCSINGHQRKIAGDTVEIPMTTLTTTIDCKNTPVIKVVHKYLGLSYTVYSSSLSANLTYTIDDSRCWGKTYNSKCDYESTAYAVWMLQKLNYPIEQETLLWLKENIGEENTINHALNYLISKDPYSKAWLLANFRGDGYWSSTSQSTNVDVYASTIAAYALREDEPKLYARARSYLAGKTNGEVFDSSLILYLLFPDQVRDSAVYMEPGVVNQKSSFDLLLDNFGLPNVLKIDAPNFTNIPSYLPLGEKRIFKVFIPENQTSFNIKITYQNREYVLPIITSFDPSRIKYPAPSSPKDDNEMNITLEPSIPTPVLLPPPKDALAFLTKSSSINMNVSKYNKKISLRFKNQWEYPLHNLTFKMDGTLDKMLSFHDSSFKVIAPDEVMEQAINVKPPLQGNKFVGIMTATSEEGTTTSIEVTLHYDEEKSDTKESKIILEETLKPQYTGGNQTFAQPNQPKTRKTNVFVIVIAVVIVIAAALFFIFKKKLIRIKTNTFEDYVGKFKR